MPPARADTSGVQWRRVLLIGLLIAANGCAGRSPRVGLPGSPRPTAPAPSIPANTVLKIGVATPRGIQIKTVPLEQYVIGAVLAESSVGRLEAGLARRVLSVQAITARTYAIANRGRHRKDGYDLCDTTHCQLFRNPAPSATTTLAESVSRDTRGEIITFQGKPIEAVFHADCGGHTSAADAVWNGTPRRYLQPVTDTFCRRPSSGWTWRIGADALGKALASDKRLTLAGPLQRVEILDRDVAGRTLHVRLGASTISGTVFRSIILRTFGPASLKSTWFDVRREGGTFVFTGRGNGHGAGLCQAGARARLETGQAPEAVIEYYYRGARVNRVG